MSDWGSVLVILSIIEGCWSTATLFEIPSEAGNAVFLGYSAERLAIAAICILGIIFLIGFFLLRKRGRYSVIIRQITFGGSALIFTLCALIFLLNYSDIGQYDTLISSLVSRYGGIFVWGILFGIEIGATVIIDSKREDGGLNRLLNPLYTAVLFGMAVVLFSLAFEYYDRVDWTRHMGHARAIFLTPAAVGILWALSVELIKGKEAKSKANTVWLFLMIVSLAFAVYRLTGYRIRLRNEVSDRIDSVFQYRYFKMMILIPAGIALIWAILSGKIKDRTHAEKLDTIFLCLLIGSLTYSIYRTINCFMGQVGTPLYSYWDLLADAFNHGHLDLTAPPTTHDLTLYNGKWYVPNPPLPAILLMPVVALLGVEGVNMTIVSALLGALNAVIVYLVLRYAAESGMTTCKRSANLWLTAVFALSTNHIWLATTGQMWFISQLVTILFIGLGTIAVIRGKPAWVSGLMIGMAVMARPNIFPIAIFLMGIYLWKAKPYPEVEWGKVVRWAIGFGIPVLICVFMELLYNYLRFEDWFDFGYVTINGAESIVEAVQKYGMFHPHFLRENFEVMFLRMPRIDTTGERFFFQPGYAGYSIFAMTPAFIYLIRGIKKNWWVIGAWVSVILTVGLLLLYHNTGAEQVGYRYIQDAIIPLLLLLGVGVGEKPGILFKMLTILGVAINLLSTYWWYIGRA